MRKMLFLLLAAIVLFGCNQVNSGPSVASKGSKGTASPDWETYASPEGQFSLKYPSDFEFHPGETPSADGVWIPVPNTITLLSPAPDFALSIRFETLPADVSLAEFINQSSQCYDVSADRGEPVMLGGHEVLFFADTNCGPFGSTEIYAINDQLAYRIWIQSAAEYENIRDDVESVLSTFEFLPKNTSG